jgi:hypothetical protein
MTIYPTVNFQQWRAISTAVLAHRANKTARHTTALNNFGGAIIGCVMAVTMFNPSTRLLGIGLAAAYVLYHWLWKSQQRKRLAAIHQRTFDDMQPVLNGNRMEVDEDGIRGTWVGDKASYSFSWPAFIDRLDRDSELVFLYAPCCYISVPKASLSREDVQQISAWFEQSRR